MADKSQLNPAISPTRIERRSIDVVPAAERHGTPRSQFTLWFGANMQITAIVDGALAVVFGADALWAIIGLLIGNLVGGVVMALHSAQGPRLGLPQMISSRAQFGVFGAAVPLVLVIIMYLGFAATGTVLAGQAVNQIVGVDAPVVGIVIFGVLTALVATLGYRYIHVLGRVATVVGIVGFSYLVIRLVTNYDLGTLIGQKPFEAVTFLLAISLAADVRAVRSRLLAIPASGHPREHHLPLHVPGQRCRFTGVDDPGRACRVAPAGQRQGLPGQPGRLPR